MARNFGGQPSFLRIFQSPFLLTVSNAFVRSTKAMNNSLFSLLSGHVDAQVYNHVLVFLLEDSVGDTQLLFSA